jgi:hypothetical protein
VEIRKKEMLVLEVLSARVNENETPCQRN